MIAKFFKEAFEELSGADEYMRLAMKEHHDHPQWAAKYHQMARDEKGHAEHLFKMAEEEVAAHKEITPLEKSLIDEMKEEYHRMLHRTKMMIDMFSA